MFHTVNEFIVLEFEHLFLFYRPSVEIEFAQREGVEVNFFDLSKEGN
jgi:hypothetical protein